MTSLVYKCQLQRCLQYRGDFMAEVLLYEPSQFVWVDESGCDRKDHIRKFGYALKGEPLVYHRILHRGKCISAIAAMAYWQWSSTKDQLEVMSLWTLFGVH